LNGGFTDTFLTVDNQNSVISAKIIDVFLDN